MLPVRKIYIDSRFRSSDSISSTDFKVDLPTTYYMPENTALFITDLCIPVSWYMIDANRNNKLYFRVYRGLATAGNNNSEVFTSTIPSGNYNITSLASAIATAMNTNRVHADGTTTGLSIGTFTATANLTTNTISISNSVANPTPSFPGYRFKILTDTELPANGITAVPYSLNKVLQNTTASMGYSLSYTSGVLDMHPVRNLYLSSPNLGTYDTLNITGDQSVVKKIPVNANYNEMIYDQVVLPYDYIDVSKQTLRRLEFQLKDIYGGNINLQGDHWSFSLLFAKIQDG